MSHKQFVMKDLSELGHFGGVQCADCGWKAEDVWDDSPEGFFDVEGQAYCEMCVEKYK